MTDDWLIELLARRHDRRQFDCGVASLNDFLRLHARQNADEDVSRTYVATLAPSLQVLGFYTICGGSVERKSMPPLAARRLPNYPVPTANLARLAVDKSCHGRGLGSYLLLDALRRIARLADEIGIRAVTVDAIDVRARAFYAKFGFARLLDDELHLLLPVAMIRKLGI